MNDSLTLLGFLITFAASIITVSRYVSHRFESMHKELDARLDSLERRSLTCDKEYMMSIQENTQHIASIRADLSQLQARLISETKDGRATLKILSNKIRQVEMFLVKHLSFTTRED